MIANVRRPPCGGGAVGESGRPRPTSRIQSRCSPRPPGACVLLDVARRRREHGARQLLVAEPEDRRPAGRTRPGADLAAGRRRPARPPPPACRPAPTQARADVLGRRERAAMAARDVWRSSARPARGGRGGRRRSRRSARASPVSARARSDSASARPAVLAAPRARVWATTAPSRLAALERAASWGGGRRRRLGAAGRCGRLRRRACRLGRGRTAPEVAPREPAGPPSRGRHAAVRGARA